MFQQVGTMYDTITVAVSFVETAGQMMEVAFRLINPGGTIHVLNVIEVPYHLPFSYADEQREKARKLLQTIAYNGAKEGISVRYSIIAARSAAEVIVERARQWGCSLILMGASMRTSRESVLLGDVFNYLIKHAPCEVISISYLRGPKLQFKRILVPTSGYKHSERAAHVALSLVDKPGGTVTAIYVAESDRPSKVVDEIERACERLGIQFKPVIKVGPIAQTVVEEARAGNYDLLIIGATERPRRLKFILGSVADDIVKNAPIRVMVVRTKIT